MRVRVLKPFADGYGPHAKGEIYKPHGPDLPGLLAAKMVEPTEYEPKTAEATTRRTRETTEARPRISESSAGTSRPRRRG